MRPAPAAATITVIEHSTHDGVTGNGGESQGDIFWFYNPVYDETDSTKVGSDQGTCIRMNPKKGTWRAPGRRSSRTGSSRSRGRSTTRRTVRSRSGRTGSYSGASGTMDLHCYAVGGGTSKCKFVFTLT